MSRVEMLSKCLQPLKGDHSVTLSDAEALAAIMDCPIDAAQEWLASFGCPRRSLTATRALAERVGLNWQEAMDAAGRELRLRQDWTLDEAAPYALIWIIERLIDRQSGANGGRDGAEH